ncbi:MAG: hypothetical protein JWR44_3012, partial [Hymenobacter sp.]|nr:hypothetical protein [Hymenobacter sp.]
MRFLVFVAALGLLVASLYLALIFGNVPYAALQRLGQVAYYEYAPDGPNYLTLALTPGSYKALRIGSWGLLACSSLATIAVLQKAIFRREILRLKLECSLATTALATVIRSLTVGQRLLAAMLLLLTLGAQVLWLLNDPLSPDEIGSYDAFVHEGPAAIASFYPIPNNHVGYNFLSWLMAQVLPGSVRLTLRLPSLLVATAGTALSYALLTRISNFRVATLVTALFGLTKLTIIYAAAGRGYYLQLACLQLAFFATYELATGGRYRRLSWAVFTSASVIGLYAIPTFALPLASLAAALLVAGRKFGPGHRRLFWTQGLFTLAVIGAISFVLYTPVGCVSGWRQLLGNRYLAPHSMVAFWNLSRAYLYETTGMLLGAVRPGLIATAGTLALTPLVLLRKNISTQTKQLAWTCWGLLVLPLVLMLA